MIGQLRKDPLIQVKAQSYLINIGPNHFLFVKNQMPHQPCNISHPVEYTLAYSIITELVVGKSAKIKDQLTFSFFIINVKFKQLN